MNYNIWDIKENEKIAVVDLDDVLASNLDSWLKFVGNIKGYVYDDLNYMKSVISYSEYKQLKARYRESGEKENIPVIKGAKEFTDKLKSIGFTIIIITRRPLFIHKCLFKQTKNWLEKNNIKYDALFFEEKKHLKLIAEIENVLFITEDNRYIANTVARFGIKCYLLNNKYNQGEIHSNVIRVSSFDEIINDVSK